MADSREQFGKNSIWNTSTPSDITERLSFYVGEAGHFYALPEYCVTRDRHDSFLLLYTVKGQGYVKTENIEFLLDEGTGLFFDCRHPHSYGSVENSWEFYWMHVTGPGALLYYESLNAPEPFILKDSESFVRNFNDVLKSMVQPDTLSRLKTESLTNRLFYRIASETVPTEGESDINGLIRKISAFIDENYQSSITVRDIATHFNISEYYLIRRFKSIMGMPPYNYLINRRIAEAKKILALTEDPVSEVALKCGFSDSAGFIACFKSRTGSTPLQYRKDFRS